MRSGKSLLIRGTALALTLLLLCGGALANSEVDDEGGIWDYDKGTYTAPDGRVVNITPDDGTAEDTPSTTRTENSDGTITIVDNGKTYIENPDGSITVESGSIQTVEGEKENGLTGDEAWALSMANAAIANGGYTETWYFDGSGSMEEVIVAYMGVYRSMVWLNGEEMLVNTSNLIWTTEAPLEKVLAVVTAKTYARLFEKSTKKSTILDKVYCGTVMRVIKTDKNWTLVDYKGIRGYIQTDSLKFYENEAREYRAGYVATKSGHTYGDSTVHVRNDPKGSQQEEYRVGTPITIIEDDGKWCRIEVEGHMCYILKEFTVYAEEGTSEELGMRSEE